MFNRSHRTMLRFRKKHGQILILFVLTSKFCESAENVTKAFIFMLLFRYHISMSNIKDYLTLKFWPLAIFVYCLGHQYLSMQILIIVLCFFLNSTLYLMAILAIFGLKKNYGSKACLSNFEKCSSNHYDVNILFIA